MAGCPCCWKIEELRAGAAAGAPAPSEEEAKAEAKALDKARKYTGCRIWRRYL